jgi:Putative beta-barrel porin-2, OmpL-like. bbp2
VTCVFNQPRSPAILTTISFVLLLSCAARAVSQSAPTSAAPAARHPQDPIEGCAKGSENQSFAERLVESYKTHLALNGGDPAVPPTNVLGGSEVPESSPPWPYSTWNIGGSPAIGVENLYSSALMDALYCGKDGQELKDSRFTVYGWLEPGANLSTSHTKFNYQTGAGGNAPAAYDFEPNTAQLDQATLYFERTPDEIQRDHFDWGGRLALLYGTDYRYTFSQGDFSNQYTDSAKRYGFDVPMYYLDFWFPGVAMGSNVRVGRYISMWQSHTPNVQNPQGVAMIEERYSYLRVGAPFGAICNPAVVTCYSYAWALVNYINYQFGPRDIATWRTDYLDDARGQRTGFKTRYYESI